MKNRLVLWTVAVTVGSYSFLAYIVRSVPVSKATKQQPITIESEKEWPLVVWAKQVFQSAVGRTLKKKSGKLEKRLLCTQFNMSTQSIGTQYSVLENDNTFSFDPMTQRIIPRVLLILQNIVSTLKFHRWQRLYSYCQLHISLSQQNWQLCSFSSDGNGKQKKKTVNKRNNLSNFSKTIKMMADVNHRR